jgi:hypothetical protein
MLPSLLLALFSTLSVAAADCTSFLPSGGIPINDLNADLKLSESPVAFFDISPSLASFAGQHFEWREESPPTVTMHRHVWGSCEKGGMSRDGTVEAGEQVTSAGFSASSLSLVTRTDSNGKHTYLQGPSYRSSYLFSARKILSSAEPPPILDRPIVSSPPESPPSSPSSLSPILSMTLATRPMGCSCRTRRRLSRAAGSRKDGGRSRSVWSARRMSGESRR